MASESFIATVDDLADVHVREGDPELWIPYPIRGEATFSVGDVDGYPVRLSLDRACEWFARLKTLAIEVSHVDSGEATVSFTKTFNLNRVLGFFGDERDLVVTVPTFTGSYSESDWNGNAGATLDIGATVKLYDNSFGDGSRLIWDESNDTVFPAFYIEVSALVTTPGTAFTVHYEQAVVGAGGPDEYVGTGSFLEDVDGFNAATRIDPSIAAVGTYSGGLSLTLAEWFGWDDGDGPYWDSATGAQLRDPKTIPAIA